MIVGIWLLIFLRPKRLMDRATCNVEEPQPGLFFWTSDSQHWIEMVGDSGDDYRNAQYWVHDVNDLVRKPRPVRLVALPNWNITSIEYIYPNGEVWLSVELPRKRLQRQR